MAKPKTTFFCQNCGAAHAKWMGQCNTCSEWNTIVEEVIHKEVDGHLWYFKYPIKDTAPP